MQFSTDEELTVAELTATEEELSVTITLELDRASDDELTTIAEELSTTTLELSGSTDEEISVTALSPELGSGLELESSPQATSPNAAITATELIVKTLRFMLYSPFALPCRRRHEFVLAVPALKVATVLTDP